jgi:hypothetical protein
MVIIDNFKLTYGTHNPIGKVLGPPPEDDKLTIEENIHDSCIDLSLAYNLNIDIDGRFTKKPMDISTSTIK